MVDSTVDGKDNKEEETREVADSRMYHISWNFLKRIWYAVVMVFDMREFLYFWYVWPHIKYIWVGGWRHRGQEGEPGGEDH